MIKRVNRPIMYGLLTTLVLLIVAAACSSDEPDATAVPPAATATTATGATQPPPATAVPTTPDRPTDLIPVGLAENFPLIAKWHWSKLDHPFGVQPTKGGTFLLEGRFDLNTWDPRNPAISSLAIQMNVVYNRLLKADHTMETAIATRGRCLREICLEGDLAESWKVIDGGDSIVYTLADGIRWQDVENSPAHGRAFVASDVKFAYDQYMTDDRATGQKSIFRQVTSIVADDAANTVTFNFSSPAAYFMYSMAGPLVPVFNREAAAVEGRLDEDPPIGTGPFQITNHIFNSVIEYEANPTYHKVDSFGQSLPYLDGIRSVWLSDDAVRSSAFRTDQIHSYMSLTGDARQNIEKTELSRGAQLRVMEQNAGGNFFFGPPHDVEPFSNVNFRRALSMALDRDQLVEAAYGDQGRWSLGYPTDWLGREFPYTNVEFGEFYQYNPDAARALLVEEGLDGIEFEIHTTARRNVDGQVALGIEFWKDIGLRPNLTIDEDVAYNAASFSHDIDFLLGGAWYSGGVDWDDFTYRMMLSGEPGNYLDINDPELDVLLREAQTEFDRTARIAMNKKVIAKEFDQIYRIFGAVYLFAEWTKPDVRNWLSHDIYFWVNGWGLNAMETVWLAK